MKHYPSAVALVCAYEVVAIMTHKVPTISRLCARKPALIPAVLVGLAAHLVQPLVGSRFAR